MSAPSLRAGPAAPASESPERAPAAADPSVAWDAAAGTLRVHGHEAARRVLTDPHLDVFRDPSPARLPQADEVPSAADFLASWFSRQPREGHREVRRHLVRPYAEPSVAPLAAALRGIADEQAAALGDACDLVRDYLQPFWLRGTAGMLGVPAAQHDRLARAATALSAVLALPRLDARAEAVADECIRFLRVLTGHLLRLPDPPAVVRSLRAVADGEGGVWRATATLAQLLTAGLHPTVTGAALAWRTLHERPDLLARVQAGELDPATVADEVLRLQPPFPYLHRWALEGCACHGPAIPPGAHVLVDLRAANRDPRVFDRPDDIEPGRDARLTLSFGHGAHRCVGPALARLQIGVALEALLGQLAPPRPVAGPGGGAGDPSGHLVVVRSLPCRRAVRPFALHAPAEAGPTLAAAPHDA